MVKGSEQTVHQRKHTDGKQAYCKLKCYNHTKVPMAETQILTLLNTSEAV